MPIDPVPADTPLSRLPNFDPRAVEVVRIEQGSDPATAIVEAAAERGASVIVIGLRHRTPVGKLIMGSVAQRILIDAACPVLAVKEGSA